MARGKATEEAVAAWRIVDLVQASIYAAPKNTIIRMPKRKKGGPEGAAPIVREAPRLIASSSASSRGSYPACGASRPPRFRRRPAPELFGCRFSFDLYVRLRYL